jgi:hypothetical protein
VKGGSSNPFIFKGTVTTATDATHFASTDLIGYGNDALKDWYIYVFYDTAGTDAAPQGEQQAISDYVSSTGTFTHTAFTADLAVGDEVFIMHPYEATGGDATEAKQDIIIADVGDASSSSLGSLYGIIGDPAVSILSIIDMLSRPSIDFIETWQDEVGIDATVWTVTDPATGAAWSRGASGAYLRATSAPNASETTRLVSDQRWVAAPDTYGTNTVLRRLVLEFELKLTTVANIMNATSFLGLTPGAGDNRGGNNIIGFALASDVLQSVTDNGGAETVNTTFGETLTNWNKLKIDISAGHVKFYVNEVEVADHTTNLPDAPMYINYYIVTEAGGAATIELGNTRAWTEDIAR